jgi:hypothetical protein
MRKGSKCDFQSVKISGCLGFNINVVTNGDAESGACETGSGVTHPTGWNYNGTITQIYYNNTANVGYSTSIPGPR